MMTGIKRVESSTLFLSQLFQSGIRSLAYLFNWCHKPKTSLSTRIITIGGVENYGNSCAFSALLQELAACPPYTDLLLKAPLIQQPGETKSHFLTRQQLQLALRGSIEKIRTGKRVAKEEVMAIGNHLHHLGWKGIVPALWRRLLYRLAPSLFPLPQYSVDELYAHVMDHLAHAPLPIVFLADRATATRQPEPTLWRLATTSAEPMGDSFSLKLFHVYEKRGTENHLVVYLKRDDGWLRCDDEQVQFVPTIQSGTIYRAIYESLPL